MSDFSFTLDGNSKVKLYYQLYSKFAEAIDNGTIVPGKKLPSVRTLSDTMKISRNTVTKAYSELEKNGYLYSVAKSGFFAKRPDESVPSSEKESQTVPENPDEIPTVDSIVRQRQKNPLPLETAPIDFPENTVPKTEVPLAPHPHSVIRSLSNSSSIQYPEILSVKEPVSFEEDLLDSFRVALTEKNSLLHKKSATFGDETFRTALSAFMYNFHKLNAKTENIIVGSCIEQLLYNILRLNSINSPYSKVTGMGLLSRAEHMVMGTLPEIVPTVAIAEDPDDTIRHVFLDAGIQVKEIPLDEAGLNMDYLVTSGCNLVFVTPSDCLAGADKNLMDQRKAEILSWASAAPYRYIIEFDTNTSKGSDGTFKQHDIRDKVIYLNSFRHLLDKGINSSWIVLPHKLTLEYTSRYTTFDCTLSYLDQLALTDFIISGKLEKHLTTLEQL